MSNPSSTPSPAAVVWRAYRCPECSSVFRTTSEKAGSSGSCPSCKGALQIPTEYDPQDAVASNPTPEVKKATRDTFRTAQIDPDQEWKKGLKKRRANDLAVLNDTPAWEGGGEAAQVHDPGLPWVSILSVLTLVGLLFGGGVYYYRTQQNDLRDANNPENQPEIVREASEAANNLLSLTKNQREEDVENTALDVVTRFQEFDLEAVSAKVREFIEAPTMADRLKLVRNPEEVARKMEHYHRVYGTYEPNKLMNFDDDQVSYRDAFVSGVAQLSNFTDRLIALEQTENGYLVDWESWVGYCDLFPEELRKKRPTEPVKIRVRFNAIPYFNYAFDNDEEWLSYRLFFADGEEAMWGYVRRDTPLEREFLNSTSSTCMLKVRFPEKARSGDQMEILEIATVGWLTE